MKYTVCIAFLLCLVGLSLGAVLGTVECGQRFCLDVYNPVCGERDAGGYLIQKIFSNECEMAAANDCHEGWVPCTV